MNKLEAEALRYMGARQPDERTLTLVRACMAELESAPPRHVTALLPAREAIEAFGSEALAAHLRGCDAVVLLAATLGTRADQLIRRAEASDTLRAAALHAAAAAKIEAYCDSIQAQTPGANRPRFSPGYGDFLLAGQAPLLKMTDAGRRIGLYLTEGCMLVPEKSITAVMGIGPALADCGTNKCARCAKADCIYRGERTGWD